jgi:hypothetical protein
VLAGVARAVGVELAGSGSPLEALVEYFGDDRSLLILDNLEQVVDAAGDVDALLARCRGLLILATRHVRALAPVAPLLAWVVAIGCCMHALIDGTLRIFSVTGVHPTQLPATFWRSFDRHAADLQDLLLNEPWFLVEGLLWAAFGLAFVDVPRRRTWLASAVLGCLLLTVLGVLSGIGVIGSFQLG